MPHERSRQRYHARWRQALLDTVYLLSGFVLATTWWTILVVLLSTGLGASITLIGIPVLVASLYIWIWMAESERWRARVLTGIGVPRPYRPLTAPTWARRLWQRLRDPSVWRDLVYLLLVFFPLSLFTFIVAAVVWGIPFALIAQLAMFWTGAGMEVGGFKVDTFVEALSFALGGIALLTLVPWPLRWLTALHGLTVKGLLGRRSAEQVQQLTRQRTEAVDAAVAERRRIERDLHDGAQQRLTALAIDLGRARVKLDSDPEAAKALVEQAHEDAKQALTELRNLARGIHPAILTDRGLDAALSALAVRTPTPVDISVQMERRPASAIESTAYFVVAEALANASKHAAASQLYVRVRQADDLLVVEVEDNGLGGAHIEPGGGLEGLTTRVATVDGAMAITSPDGGPTIVRAELPCAS